MNESTNQSINQSINQSVSQSISQPMNHCVSLLSFLTDVLEPAGLGLVLAFVHFNYRLLVYFMLIFVFFCTFSWLS